MDEFIHWPKTVPSLGSASTPRSLGTWALARLATGQVPPRGWPVGVCSHWRLLGFSARRTGHALLCPPSLPTIFCAHLLLVIFASEKIL